MSSSSSKQEPCGPHGRLELGRLYPLGAAMTFALDMEDARRRWSSRRCRRLAEGMLT